MAKAKATKTEAKAKNPLGLALYDPADYLRMLNEVAMYLEAFFERRRGYNFAAPYATATHMEESRDETADRSQGSEQQFA
jgi:hypothetical protein